MTQVPSEAIEALIQALGADAVRQGPAELVAYSYDGTFQQQIPALAVLPITTQQVADVMRIAARFDLAVTPRGAGSGLAGGAVPSTGAIVLSLTRMNRILELDLENSVAVVEAGVLNADLGKAATQHGLFYPPDPSSLVQSTLGGNVATNAGGPRCLKYGVTRHYVLGMSVVLADGQILSLGGKLLKNATGYPLMHLFIGSEGTLGIVTQITLRLIPLPPLVRTAAAYFSRLEDASICVTRILGAGILPVALELLDRTCLELVEQHMHLGLPQAEAALILEQDGTLEAAVLTDVEQMATICREWGATEVKIARSENERTNLWQMRRAVGPALGRAAPNKLGEDIVVPRSQITAMVRRVGAIAAEVGLVIPVFGHAGDGNLHPNILFDRRQPEVMTKVAQAATAIFQAAVDLGGTLSGEHGVGTLKREFLEMSVGADALAAMRLLKSALDPHNRLNPGKVLPDTKVAQASDFLMRLPTMPLRER